MYIVNEIHKDLIKEMLAKKQGKVYSVIVSLYYKEALELKPILFRKWFARALKISEDDIKIKSLYSALGREEKRQLKSKVVNLSTSSNEKVDHNIYTSGNNQHG